MKNKLNILLIDDDVATNFLNTSVIEDLGCAKSVVSVRDGREGINYLTKAVDGKYPQPDLIFLDVNMPVMNGWEFLEEYETLEAGQKAGLVIVMLTTSLNPEDKEKARAYNTLDDFVSKPLTTKKLTEILNLHSLL